MLGFSKQCQLLFPFMLAFDRFADVLLLRENTIILLAICELFQYFSVRC